jgi:sterol desaturase/sphingolipid hydroxylase (fatty acid hydroxylase superfamily)
MCFNEVALPCFYLLSDFPEESTQITLYSIPITLEIMFYTVHLLLHTRFFYEKIHKIHHCWIHPIPISTFYTHPLEQLFANILPIILSACFAGLDQETARLWFNFSLISTLIFSHGGYIMDNNNPHDKHHVKIHGTLGILDNLFRTNA